MFAFNALPDIGHGAVLPAYFADAVRLRLRLPLALLAGTTACKCGCAMGPFEFNSVAMSYPAPPAYVTAPLAMSL